MPELSPVELLQERYRSAAGEYPDPDGLAAALDALADQVVPEEKISQLMPGAPQAYALQRRVTRRQLLAIAAELRGQEGTDG